MYSISCNKWEVGEFQERKRTNAKKEIIKLYETLMCSWIQEKSPCTEKQDGDEDIPATITKTNEYVYDKSKDEKQIQDTGNMMEKTEKKNLETEEQQNKKQMRRGLCPPVTYR